MLHYPSKQGLYDPVNEKDACGVGLVAQLDGDASHKLVTDGLEMLERMSHRGACGCDENSGDGAGILVGIPDAFFRERIKQQTGLDLPPFRQYAAGLVFLPKAYEERKSAKAHVEDVLTEHGQSLLCWRSVPTNNQCLGQTSLESEPFMEQLFIKASDDMAANEDAFNRLCFVMRKIIHRRWSLNWTEKEQTHRRLHICSLSPRTIVYKGQLTPEQVRLYYIDLSQRDFHSHLALVHSRFSTNTFPSWERAQPLRVLAHNGEINTLKGNSNWMLSRRAALSSELLGDHVLKEMLPIIGATNSDSGAFDNIAELLMLSGGRSPEESIMMMVPEPWQKHQQMDQKKKAFYEFNSCLIEPWDGPAFIAFTDGLKIGAVLDRNGLRPGRYYITKDRRVILASEVGVLDIDDEDVVSKKRLVPGEMFLIDFKEKRIVPDDQIKERVASRHPYQQWLKDNCIKLKADILSQQAIMDLQAQIPLADKQVDLNQRLKAFGYSSETMERLIGPMALDAMEALGSMGNDQALACLSEQPRIIFDYFQQLFAQVTNPPIDPIRESIVMSLKCPIGPEGNLLSITEGHAQRIMLDSPLLDISQFHHLVNIEKKGWTPTWLDATFPREQGPDGLQAALDRLRLEAERAVQDGARLLIITDRQVDRNNVAVPSLLSVGAIHQHLVKVGLRALVGLVAECGDAREVHHICLLTGFGVDAVYPWTVYDACWRIYELNREEARVKDGGVISTRNDLIRNYKTSILKGMLKVLAKMGISTLQGYKGAMIFEAVGVAKEVMDMCFTGAASRIGGSGFHVFGTDCLLFHNEAFPLDHDAEAQVLTGLRNRGEYHWRNNDAKNNEHHLNHPQAIAKLQHAARTNSREAYQKYSEITNEMVKKCTLRGQFGLKIDANNAIPLEEVEAASEIVKRFSTGAMSYGSISIEAHSTLAVAMNRIEGKSNTGEGGEHISRYAGKTSNGDTTRSAIKQVASGRFGVSIYYLANSDEIQIKMAQGAKPGEGGELPGYKVVGEIAKTRNSTEGVGLISPPPHHDIYSIEDLAQLISDLKNANPTARISVKLVSEVGVGVIATGVVKGKADHVLISGHDGGTGASKWTGIKHAGLPWELGLAETHQTLVLNGLRGRVILQTDGQLKTGLDVVKATMLGAEEFCFATAPLIALGCIMMRKCHLNTCPVGIATQDPVLRQKFRGEPEHVVNFLFMVAEEARQYMAQMGFRSIDEMVGRSDLLEQLPSLRAKTDGLDLSSLLKPAHQMNPDVAQLHSESQDHMLENVLDRKIIATIGRRLKAGKRVRADFKIKNTDRTVGAITSYELTKRWGLAGLPEKTVHLRFKGSAGQSFGAFTAPGMLLELNGDANDYVGKGLSGGSIVVYPPKGSGFKAEENIIVGNVCLYGATGGYAFFRGRACQRFAVRNSGAHAVVEGVGDHCCEYMTGGVVVVLGSTGRNFAAGMSGGLAFVYDPKKQLRSKCNLGLVQLERMDDDEDRLMLQELIDQHRIATGSAIADNILWNWNKSAEHFVKVIPTDYKRVLEQQKAKKLALSEQKSKLQADTSSSPLAKPKEGCGKDCACASAPAVASASTAPGSAPSLDIEELAKTATALDQKKSNAKSMKKKGDRPSRVANPKKKRGFVEYERRVTPYRPASERIQDFKEIYTSPDPVVLKTQAARCMDCGIPFCHDRTSGCPLGNKIPEWNELVFQNKWKEALHRLLETNNFPEFTGRVCPAPCEGACVLGIIDDPVTIKNIECQIIDRAWAEGWMLPHIPEIRTGKRIAIIGSGPSGLACADQLNKAGHEVTVFERDDRIGGLLMYGVPNMKLDKKAIVERRVDLMAAEGVIFRPNTDVGIDISASELANEYDALVLCTGSMKPRDLPIPGRDLQGIDFAMNFLSANTKSYLDSNHSDAKYINSKNKRVIVIGGGDTGNDCIGTAVRHGAKSVVNFELLPKPAAQRVEDINPWPEWPRFFRVDYGHKEVAHVNGDDPRRFCTLSKRFLGNGQGAVSGVETVQIEWTRDGDGRFKMQELEDTKQVYGADLVLLALGFTGPMANIATELGIDLDNRGNFRADYGVHRTNIPKIFASGDCRRGQSLVVTAIAEGRQCAREVDKYLMGQSSLP